MRLDVVAVGVTSDEQMISFAQSNDNPRVEPRPCHGRKLAVVGGGPLIRDRLPELKAWDGDIWAINYTANWLIENGIEPVFYTVDSNPIRGIRAKRAVVASSVHPETIEPFEYVEYFDLSEVSDTGIIGGTTSATRAPLVALRLGYSNVSFFGCEGSFLEQSHVDRDISDQEQLIVRANGADYRTNMQMYLQCQELSKIIGTFPDVFHCRSGGLLEAIIADPDWEVVAVSGALKEHIERINGCQGLFEQKWEGAIAC